MSLDSTSAARPAGISLAFGAFLLAVVLPLHGPISSDLAVQMAHISEDHSHWVFVHWIAFVALVALAAASFQLALAASHGRGAAAPPWAWVLLALGSLITTGTAVLEATAVRTLAQSGDLDGFLVWWGFASGLGNGFMFVGLATAAIAWSLRGGGSPSMPAWSCNLAAILGLLSAAGWSLGQHFGVELGGPVWFASTLLMSVWLLWLGLRLARS